MQDILFPGKKHMIILKTKHRIEINHLGNSLILIFYDYHRLITLPLKQESSLYV